MSLLRRREVEKERLEAPHPLEHNRERGSSSDARCTKELGEERELDPLVHEKERWTLRLTGAHPPKRLRERKETLRSCFARELVLGGVSLPKLREEPERQAISDPLPLNEDEPRGLCEESLKGELRGRSLFEAARNPEREWREQLRETLYI